MRGSRLTHASAAGTVTGLLLLVALSTGAAGQTPAAARPLLDVPYLTQTGDLCGGAALAMVLRYWGDPNVFAEDFATLLDGRAHGIATAALASAARARGWAALESEPARDAAMATLRAAIDRSRPAIALIEDSPGRMHYVVVIGLTDQSVVFHDPARAPFRVMTIENFTRVWAVASFWSLVLAESAQTSTQSPDRVPIPDRDIPHRPSTSAPEIGPCEALVAQSVEFFQADRRDEAERGLMAATRLCPDDPGAWRELAGVRFLAAQFRESARLASIALTHAPADEHARRLLATSQYLQDRWTDALGTWNPLGEPRMDTVDVRGAIRTRQPIVIHALGLEPRQVLTPSAFARASHRLAALPAASFGYLRFEPLPDGRARLEAVVVERETVPSGLLPIAIVAARALTLDDLRVDVANATGSGELWTGQWRWTAGRPRVGASLALPAPGPLRGVMSLDAFWERESYAPALGAAADRLTRRRVSVSFSDWAPHNLYWERRAALDRIGDRDFFAVDAAIDKRFAADRVSLRLGGGWWAPFASPGAFGSAFASAAWRSTTSSAAPVWSAVATMTIAGAAAPPLVWPGAGTGQGRDLLLRAHPLFERGVIDGPAFGRRLAHASAEYVRPIVRTPAGLIGAAAFVDAAQAWRGLPASPASRLLVDVGIGLRLRTPDPGGSIRIDFAHGLRDGGRAWSVGWGTTWPHAH